MSCDSEQGSCFLAGLAAAQSPAIRETMERIAGDMLAKMTGARADVAGSVLIEWPSPHAEVLRGCDDANGVHMDTAATVIKDAATGERLTGVNWFRIVCPSSGPVFVVVMSVKGDDGEPLRESQASPAVGAHWVERWYQVAGMSIAAAPGAMERLRPEALPA